MDGNTVDMDRERTQFADNSLKYQTDLTVLGGQIKGHDVGAATGC